MKKFLLLLWVIALAFGVLGTQSALAFPVSGTFGEHEYAVVGFPSAENTFWTAAKDRIAAEGSGWYFADITSQEEQDFIASLLSTYDTGSNADFVWVGGWQDPNSSTPTDNWVWYATGKPFTYANWANDNYLEPNDYLSRDERYLALDKRDDPNVGVRNWLWNDAPNDGDGLARAYVAERAVPEPATLLLLGTGLIGIRVLARRKFKK